MSVNEKLMTPGTFNVLLNLDTTPNSVVNSIEPWGNIVLTPTRISPDEFTDAQIRDMARYVGIVTVQEITEEGIDISGKGILAYLGDTDSRGMVLARNAGVGAVRSYSEDTLDDVIDRSASTPYGLLRDEEANQRAVRKGTVTEVDFDTTVLLLNFEGTDGDTTTTDGSEYSQNQIISFIGTADISSDQANYGNTSLNLTTDGFITVADRPELDLTYQEFTVEWWEYRTSISGNPTVIARNDDTYSPFIFGKVVNGRNKAFITHDGDGYNEDEDLNIDMGSVNLNQWNHFAISHNGDFFRAFKNGVIQQTDKRPELYVRVSSDALQIGKGQGGNFFEGYIDGLAITRGAAKYWDAFTPSASAPTAQTAAKTYTGKHYMESAYKAVKDVCVALGAEFKINNDGTLDVGPASALFTGHENNTPQGMIVRDLSGSDPTIKGYSGIDLSTEFNAEDYVSRVELIASQYGKEINLGQADAKSVPYKDLHGQTLERIQILSENDVPDSLRDVRAEAYLNEYNKIQKTLNVGLEDYDVSGDIGVGDIIFVYDPDVGFEDTDNDASLENRDKHEITYQGQILHPIKIRVMGLSFPVTDEMGVFYRDGDGNYTDLTDYVEFEVGVTQIEVGSTTRNINEDLRGTASIIAAGGTNEFTVPDAPTSFTSASGTYQDATGRPYAFAKLTWEEPTNTDGSRITDGNMYRVRYRQVTDVDGNNLIDQNDNQVTDYEYLTVEFGTTSVVIKGLGASNTYEFGVAAIDNSGFSGGFSILTAVQMPTDATVPPEPLPPTGTFGSIAGNATRVQIQHKLGAAKDSDGNSIANPTNFSLPLDIDHLNVYRGLTSGFTISDNNFVGQIEAKAGHISLQITAIGEFQSTTEGVAYYKVTAVDVVGNESDPSTAAQVTEELINTAYISNAAITEAKIEDLAVTDAKINTLTAGKITAGTISGEEIIIDTDSATDPSNPVLGTIRSSNYQSGSQGWIINSDGSVEFSSGTFRGALSGATGTFSGSLSSGVSISAPTITGGTISGTSGTFTGDISGASGTFTGDLTGADISGGTINIGSGTFQVSNAGAITATSGTIGGISLGSTSISSSNFSGSSAGFEITSAGNATFNSINVNNPVITLGKDTGSGTPSTAANDRIKIGDAVVFNRDVSGTSSLVTTKSFLVLPDGDEDNPSLAIDGQHGTLGFFVDTPLSGISRMQITNGDNNVASWSTANTDFLVNDKLVLGGSIQVGGSTGGNSQYIGKNSSGSLGFHDLPTGNNHPDSDHSFATTGHDHDSDYYSSSAGSFLAQTLSSHTSQAHSLSLGSTVSNNNSGGLFVTAVSGLSITRTNIAGAHMQTQKVYPRIDQAYAVGEPGRRYTIGYFQFGTSTSDQRLKENIEDLDLGLDFINKLQPKKYNWTTEIITTDDGEEIVTRQDIADMDMFGFMAQDVLAIDDLDNDITYGIARHNEEEDTYDLSYENMIAPLVKAVQELSAKNDELESRLAALEG